MTGFRYLAFAAAFVGCALAVGCSWTQSPSKSKNFAVSWQIQEPTRTSASAELFLTDTGYWAYKAEDRGGFEPEFAPGQLVLMEAEASDHFFVVVEAERWGYRLQRLDDRPLHATLSGQLLPVTKEVVGERHDLCAVSDLDNIDGECGLSYRHRRWHLFASVSGDEDAESPLSIEGDFDDVATDRRFPVNRRALAGGDVLGSWVETAGNFEDDTSFIAIGAHERSGSTLRATVTADEACSLSLSDSDLVRTDTVAFEKMEISLGNNPHPVAVEGAALRLGSDALLTCDEDISGLMVPMISRPLLADDSDRFFAPPSIGLHRRDLSEMSADARQAWTRAGALIAVGDPAAASYWLEEALAAEDIPEFSLTAMPVLAGAGQPERSMQLGTRATRRAWNPENIPDYLDGLIVLLGQYGEHDALQDRLERRQSLASRRLDGHRVGFYRWADLRLEVSERKSSYGPAYEQWIADLQSRGLDGWAVAMWATLAMGGMELPIVDDPDDLIPRFAEFDAANLWSAIRDQLHSASCDEKEVAGCDPRSYGWSNRRMPGDSDILDILRTTAAMQLRTGFGGPQLGQRAAEFASGAEQAAYWLAIAPLVDDVDRELLTRSLTRALRDDLADLRSGGKVCENLELWQARFENAAARSRAPDNNRSRTEWTQFASWWADSGLHGFCSTTDDFLDAIEEFASDANPWLAGILPLLEDRILAERLAPADLKNLERAAELARLTGARDTCAHWNLGVSIGAIRNGHFGAAEDHLVRAHNCLDGDRSLRDTHNLVAAYLDFERGGGRRLIRDGGVESAIAAATRRRIDDSATCVGLLPIGFHLEAHLPDSVLRIAEQLDVEPAPYDGFGLRTASGFIDEARAAYLSGLRDLQRGQFETAANALQRAQANFRRLDHLPGLARIALIDDVVFDGLLHDVADGEEFPELSTESEERDKLRRGQAFRLIDEVALPVDFSAHPDPPALITAFLLTGKTSEIEDSVSDLHTLSPMLCDSDKIRYAISGDGGDDTSIIVDDGTFDDGENISTEVGDDNGERLDPR